jgi:cytochrome c
MRRLARFLNHGLQPLAAFFQEFDMKLTWVIVGIAAVVAAPAFASKEIAQKNACLACHAADKKLVGPSYQDVAKKYAGQKDAEAALIKSIKAGGSGKWGAVPMPAQAALNDADAKSLAQWILGGGK